jgi:hypothetical protein
MSAVTAYRNTTASPESPWRPFLTHQHPSPSTAFSTTSSSSQVDTTWTSVKSPTLPSSPSAPSSLSPIWIKPKNLAHLIYTLRLSGAKLADRRGKSVSRGVETTALPRASEQRVYCTAMPFSGTLTRPMGRARLRRRRSRRGWMIRSCEMGSVGPTP